jgi:hypothetical protein
VQVFIKAINAHSTEFDPLLLAWNSKQAKA